jgi:alpha-galactosidase
MTPRLVELEGPGPALPGLSVVMDQVGDEVHWWVANRGDAPVLVDRVSLRFRVRVGEALRMFRNGYQSWSASGGGPISQAVDPSRTPDAPGLVRVIHHADPSPVAEGEVRSELVTALADQDESVVLGFDGGRLHDGTFRVRGDELLAEAWLGGARLEPGERRSLHTLRIGTGDAAEQLDVWAAWAGARAGARVEAPFQVGWCSWYHYFDAVTEHALRANLAHAADWPFDVFQLDDGYQAAIGDWLNTAASFPSTLDALARDIASAGRTPGLWLAPFLAAPTSELARHHPDWLLRRPSGRPAVGMVNPAWGGEVWVLDTTHPEVLLHLEELAGVLVAMGWRYLKLDFTYAPALEGAWHDAALTPAQRVRAAYDAIRWGAGDDAFLLGCGAPLGPCIGVVDGMRIGPDVAPAWEPTGGFAGYEDTSPSTRNAWRNTLARSFMHRRLWLNDPDCLMLRTSGTQLTDAQVRAWAHAVAASGGMAIVSDDLALLDRGARAILDEVLDVGRAVDAGARTGPAPACPDLLDQWTPTTLEGGTVGLVGHPDAGTAQLTRS